MAAFYFILMAVLVIVFLGGLGAKFLAKENGGLAASAFALVLAAVITLGFSVTTVEARSVGVQTAFGAYQGTLDNGFHLVAPWSNVEEFSTQVQFTELSNGEGSLGEAVRVNFEGGSTGQAAVVLRWSITEEGAEQLWRQYQTFDRVENRLVASELRDATRNAYNDFTPVEARGVEAETISDNIFSTLEADLGRAGIQVDSVAINDVALDDQAQSALNSIVTANAQIERAEAEQQQASIEAETATIRQGTLTPEILQQNCLDILANWNVNESGPVPATFNCNFGSADPQTIVPVN